jgi:hypothetical protein
MFSHNSTDFLIYLIGICARFQAGESLHIVISPLLKVVSALLLPDLVG